MLLAVSTRAASGEDLMLASLSPHADPRPALAYAQARPRVRGMVLQAARGAVAATLRVDRRMIDGARDRFIDARRALREFDGAGYAGRHVVPFDVDGKAALEAGTWRSDGRFFGQRGSFDGRRRRLVLGEFSFEKTRTGLMRARIDARLGRERMRSARLMTGYYLGGEIGESRRGGGVPGAARRIGASLGAYAVRSLGETLYLDGYVSLGVERSFGRHADRALAFEGVQTMPKATAGGTLTGVIETGALSLRPKVSLSYGRAAIGRTEMREGDAAAFALDHGRAATIAIALSPDLNVALGASPFDEGRATFVMSPRLECHRIREIKTVSSCQRSAELGLERRSRDATRRMGVRLALGRREAETQMRISFDFEQTF